MHVLGVVGRQSAGRRADAFMVRPRGDEAGYRRRAYRRIFAFSPRSGIPTQVVVPSVSVAAFLQGTAPTVSSSATLFKPVSDPEISGPPTSGAPPAVGGIASDGEAVAAGGGPAPKVPVV